MSNISEQLHMYLSHSFVLYALIVGVSIALCAAMVGVTLVLKRFSFIGDGLSHVAFGAMTVGTIMHVSSNLYVTMPITILAAILLLRGSQNSKVMGDAKLAILSVVSLAFGYLMMNGKRIGRRMYDIIWLHIDIDADNRRRNPMPSNLGNSYSFLRVSVQQTFCCHI